MKFSLFYHSLLSDWNHGNAHFLRGVVSDLLRRGHNVDVYEPEDSWSRKNLIKDHGQSPMREFHHVYPKLKSHFYTRESLNLEKVANDSDIVLVHEWNESWLVNGFGQLRRENGADGFRVLFHDTHHRAVSDPGWLRRFNLSLYDGVLAFGEVLSEVYRRHGWSDTVWTWHEAADTRVFYPRLMNSAFPHGDVVWIGNWGDDERSKELRHYLFNPVRDLHLKCNIYGVRYPEKVLAQLQANNISYGGWLPNFRAPEVFANHKVTVHIPRRFYAEQLPGIPTIRPFEAMACGIPLICAPWQDSEYLFSPGDDYVVVHNETEMKTTLRDLLNDEGYAKHIADNALKTILDRHTCRHRVEQLLKICENLQAAPYATRRFAATKPLYAGATQRGSHA